MTYLIEQLINGICQGAIYALFAIGYTIIVGVVGLVSFTFGEVIMIGAFAALFTATLTGGNILLTILFSFAASGLIGIPHNSELRSAPCFDGCGPRNCAVLCFV